MRSMRTKSLIALSAALALVLLGSGCNDVGEDGNSAEVAVLVKSVATAGLSVSLGGDTTATLTLSLNDRTGGSAGSFFNSVTFIAYQAAFTNLSGGLVPASISGPINSGYTSLGDTALLTLVLIPAAAPKPAAGDVVVASVKVTGEDYLGRPFSFTTDVALQFIP